LSGGGSSTDPYYTPTPSQSNQDATKPKRIEIDSQGKKKYVYDCANCGNEFKNDSPRRYKNAYCGEKCRRAAFGALGTAKKGQHRSEEDRKKMSEGQKKAWKNPQKRENRMKGKKSRKQRGPNKNPRKSKGKTYHYTCSGCGKHFETKVKRKGEQKYHSNECKNKNQGRFQRKGEYVPCANPNCNNQFYKKASREDKKYCSMDCAKSDPNYWQRVAETMKERYGRNWEWQGWEEKRTDPQIWEPLAAKMRNQDQQKCQSCNEDWKRGQDRFPVHHIIPWSQGGPDEDWNLILLCPRCHRKTDAQGGPVRFPNPYQEKLV
jgi:hypothetical protein